MTLRKSEEIEVGSTRLHSAENSLQKRLWTCRKTDCVMIGELNIVEIWYTRSRLCKWILKQALVLVCTWPDAGFQRQTRTISAPSPIYMKPDLRRLPTSESRGQRH